MFAQMKCFFSGFKNALSDKWILSTFIVYLVCFSYAFMQNFVFSEGLDQLAFRTADDVTFQYVLRHNHEHLKFFCLNSYAYGWLFWLPVTVLTYPAYLISKYAGDDTLLIVIPRDISLLFTVATAIMLYKIGRFYTSNNLLIATALILFLSFPSTGYFSLRFGTVSQTAFFSALAFYVAISRKSYDIKNIRNIGIAAGLALAVKLSAALILPFIAMVLADRLHWKISKENFKKAGWFFGALIVTYLVIGQPAAGDVLNQIKITQTNYGGGSSFFDDLQGAIFDSFSHQFIIVALLASSLFYGIKKMKDNRDILFVLINIMIVTVYLLTTIKMGAIYVTAYATVYMYLLTLGVLSIDYLGKKLQVLACVTLVASGGLLNFNNIYSSNIESPPASWNSFYLAKNNEVTLSNIATQEKVHAILEQRGWKSGDAISILMDYRGPEYVSSVNSNVQMTGAYDNLSKALNGKKPRTYDLVSFSKSGVGFMTDIDFAKKNESADDTISEIYQNDRLFVTEFLKSQKIGERTYSKIYEDNKNIVFLSNDFKAN